MNKQLVRDAAAAAIKTDRLVLGWLRFAGVATIGLMRPFAAVAQWSSSKIVFSGVRE
jgi:hypothetical protein